MATIIMARATITILGPRLLCGGTNIIGSMPELAG
jgi:hypothetical protein